MHSFVEVMLDAPTIIAQTERRGNEEDGDAYTVAYVVVSAGETAAWARHEGDFSGRIWGSYHMTDGDIFGIETEGTWYDCQNPDAYRPAFYPCDYVRGACVDRTRQVGYVVGGRRGMLREVVQEAIFIHETGMAAVI